MVKFFQSCLLLCFVLSMICCGTKSDKLPKEEANSSKPEVSTRAPEKAPAKKQEGTITVYSDQNDAIEQAIIKEYEAFSGIKVKWMHKTAAELIDQLKQEGTSSPADLVLLTGLRNLNEAKSADLLQKFKSARAEALIPEEYRDEDRHWYGLTRDATVIVYVKDSLDVSKMGYYEYFSRVDWKGKLLVPSAKHRHIQSLVASILAWDDMGKSKEFLERIVGNLAAPPFANEAAMLADLAKGTGRLALVSGSSLAKFIKENEAGTKDKWAVFHPKNMGGATHFDLSGIAICKHSTQAELAGQFIEFLGKTEIQKRYGAAKLCYPTNTMVLPEATLKAWGTYRGDDLPFTKLFQFEKPAAQILKTVAWN